MGEHAMSRWFPQYLTECLIAYPIAGLATFAWALALNLLPSSPMGALLDRQLSHLLGTPVLAAFWLTAAAAALAVGWCARRSPQSLFRASRAGEWVWVAGAVYIVVGFLTYLPVSHHWVRAALYELFVSTYDIGNMATAPFYMGIVYSLTRHLLRVRAEKRAVRGGHQPRQITSCEVSIGCPFDPDRRG
jgi:hypothetical protein